MASVLGAASRNSASSLESIVVLSNLSPICGRSLGREPVAITTALPALSSTVPPSTRVTATLRPGSSFPVPFTISILCFLNRNSTPFEFCSATLLDRFIATP